jgi:hypothetical protein
MPNTKPIAKAKRIAKERQITKERIISALQSVARKLRHTPTSAEFKRIAGISFYRVAWRFGTYSKAITAAGLKLNQSGVRVDSATLLEDWANVVRKVGALPSGKEYQQAGRYSRHCFPKRFQRWSLIPAAFCKSLAVGGLAGDWTDVVEMIRRSLMPTCGACNRLAKKREAVRLAYEAQARELAAATAAPAPREVTTQQPVVAPDTRRPDVNTANPTILPPPLWGKKCVTSTMLAVFIAELSPTGLQWITGACFPRRVLQDRPLLGAPTQLPGMAHEPVNEMGVLVLFGMLCRQLGFVVESVQAGFPDCYVKIEVEPGRWQYYWIEFEYESISFRDHGHDPRKCDLIVCWRHNWKNCPPHIQVLELSRIVEQMQKQNS